MAVSSDSGGYAVCNNDDNIYYYHHHKSCYCHMIIIIGLIADAATKVF